MSTQPPQNLVPPFTRETAAAKVRKAEDNWNSWGYNNTGVPDVLGPIAATLQ